MVNELAPRPHNSGHLTFDAAVTSQFEQQVRAICGLPLGSPELLRPAAMANLLGDLWVDGEPDWAAACRQPDVKLHLYGKVTPKPGRKMGHLTAMGRTVARGAGPRDRRARRAAEVESPQGGPHDGDRRRAAVLRRLEPPRSAAVLATMAEDGTYSDPGTARSGQRPGLCRLHAGLFRRVSGRLVLDCQRRPRGAGFRGRAVDHARHQPRIDDGPAAHRQADRSCTARTSSACADGRIRSVEGYFDSRAVPEQLGLQVVVQPKAIGPFTFGTSVRSWGGSTAQAWRVQRHRASVPERRGRDTAVRELQPRQVAAELLGMKGFHRLRRRDGRRPHAHHHRLGGSGRSEAGDAGRHARRGDEASSTAPGRRSAAVGTPPCSCPSGSTRCGCGARRARRWPTTPRRQDTCGVRAALPAPFAYW